TPRYPRTTNHRISRMSNHAANPPRNAAAKMRAAVTDEDSCTERAANSQKLKQQTQTRMKLWRMNTVAQNR
ncbi:hypothetical protein, partial [Caballeronia sp. dw_19]|uniref:hypothetical protein n=1 Tax=Caballeronia sp. dw_19 TaxID=2719791 RepID=UPI001BD621D6